MASLFQDLFNQLQAKVTEVIACATDTNAIKGLAQLALDAINANKTASDVAKQAILDNSVLQDLIDATNKNPVIGTAGGGRLSLAVFNGSIKNTTGNTSVGGDVVVVPNLETNANVWAHHEVLSNGNYIEGVFIVNIVLYGANTFSTSHLKVYAKYSTNSVSSPLNNNNLKFQIINGKFWLSIKLVSSTEAGWSIDYMSNIDEYGLLRKGHIKTPIFTLTEDMS